MSEVEARLTEIENYIDALEEAIEDGHVPKSHESSREIYIMKLMIKSLRLAVKQRDEVIYSGNPHCDHRGYDAELVKALGEK